MVPSSDDAGSLVDAAARGYACLIQTYSISPSISRSSCERRRGLRLGRRRRNRLVRRGFWRGLRRVPSQRLFRGRFRRGRRRRNPARHENIGVADVDGGVLLRGQGLEAVLESPRQVLVEG